MSVEENTAVARRFMEEAMPNPDILDEIMASDCVLHGWDTNGLEAYKTALIGQKSGLPDWRFNINEVIAGEDKVAVRWTGTATHKGWGGFPPANKQVKWDGITTLRIVDGKIVEYWHLANLMMILRQLGVLPSWDEMIEQYKIKQA